MQDRKTANDKSPLRQRSERATQRETDRHRNGSGTGIATVASNRQTERGRSPAIIYIYIYLFTMNLPWASLPGDGSLSLSPVPRWVTGRGTGRYLHSRHTAYGIVAEGVCSSGAAGEVRRGGDGDGGDARWTNDEWAHGGCSCHASELEGRIVLALVHRKTPRAGPLVQDHARVEAAQIDAALLQAQFSRRRARR